jgi:hypothetical protein
VAVAASAAGYHNGFFGRELGSAAPSDGRLQHGPADSIVLVFENSFRPGIVARRSYPFIPPPAVPAILNVQRHNFMARLDATPLPADRNWILVGNANLQVNAFDPKDRCCRMLAWPQDTAQASRFVGLTVEASKPFLVDIKVFSNLGQFVSQVAFNLDQAQFNRLPPGSIDSTRVLRILWDSRSQNGALAGTGAYVMKSHVALTQGNLSYRNTRIVGMIREP